MQNKRRHSIEKVGLHKRNRHRERYNFNELCNGCPQLIPFVKENEYGDESIDFFDPAAVKMLNTALLKYFYGIEFWDIPQDYLTPPVPGRADYIHNIADLLNETGVPEIAGGGKIRGLDIGVGANCIYPIIGAAEYGWKFVGTDIDAGAIAAAGKIVDSNTLLKGKVELRLQKNRKHIFAGITGASERFHFTVCNPPFHASAKDAQAGTRRKLSNLKQKKGTRATLNFGGRNNELWCEGGEKQFVNRMISESREFSKSCLWFTTLVSKESNLRTFYKSLKSAGAAAVKTIPMSQGNKTSRLLAWSFFTASQQEKWKSG